MSREQKTKVYMGIPSTGNRSDAQCYALRRLEQTYVDRIEFVYPEQCQFRIFHDFARNQIVEEFLKSDCDVLWFLDSDIMPPPDILDLVTEHGDKWEAAGAAYPIWMRDRVVYTIYKEHPERPGVLTYEESDPKAGTRFVTGLATGCLMLKRSLLEKLQRPYFEFKYDPESREMTEGEDLGFARKCHDLGVQFFTDNRMVCKHYKNVDLLDVTNYAIDYANSRVKAYDAQIRQQTMTLAQQNQVLHSRVQFLEQQLATKQSKQTASGLILP